MLHDVPRVSTVVKYTVEADVERRRSPRVRFQKSDDTGFLSLPASTEICHNVTLVVVVNPQLECKCVLVWFAVSQ